MGRRHAVQTAALFLTLAPAAWGLAPPVAAQQPTPGAFTVDQILGLPAPDNLIVSSVGSTIAWTFNERGARNIYVADAPDFKSRRLTPYSEDDGQELTHLAFSNDGTTLVYVRGGDHGSNRPADAAPQSDRVERSVPLVANSFFVRSSWLRAFVTNVAE